MFGQAGHIDDTVDMAAEAASYDGTVVVGDASYGSCLTNECHNLGDGASAPYNAGGAGYTWGDSLADCTTCHNYPNTVSETGDEGARHTVHVNNGSYVGSCASCHTDATAATHINTAADMDSQVSVYDSGDGSCTNTCHELVAASAGDWSDTADLNCVDCHVGTKSLGVGHMYTSGLHAVTPRLSEVTHDDTLTACDTCHEVAGRLLALILTYW